MVFRGKPSRACHSCRERRLKCDLVRPRCTQCFRARRECPGYPPESNARFLDQTDEVLAKARIAGNAGPEQAMIKSVPRNLTQPVEAPALSFFLSKYILGSNFDYLASIYTPYSDREEQLSASIEAVGLVSLSNELGSLELLERARKRYVHAIQATNRAIQDPIRVRKDDTLLAVLLLGLYEVMTCTTQPNMCLWENHINGAMALVRLRGVQQMQSRLGIRLLSQATASVAISAHRSKSEAPKELTSFVALGLQYANKGDPSWNFRLISIRSANFRAAIEQGSLRDPDVIIATAMEIDQDFVTLSRKLPPSWQYEVHHVEQADSHVLYEGTYHLYAVYGIAHGLNAWRVSRLQVNESIWEQLFRHDTLLLSSQDRATLISRVESTITGLCSEICATVPQYVELPTEPSVSVSVCRMQSPPSVISDAPSHSTESSESGFTHSTRSYGIIWPLMAVANCIIPNKSRRAWVINRLQYISKHMRNPQAHLALELLEGKLDSGKRMYMCHLL